MGSKKCNCCTEPCPMADMAHEAAKGRMYATNEFILLQKKVESGQLVEVVRCKDCKYCRRYMSGRIYCIHSEGLSSQDDNGFCSYGERRTDEQQI